MSASRLLLVVEETFTIAGRGLVVAPDADLGAISERRIRVELRRPDGTVASAEALAQVPFVNPPPPADRGLRHVLCLDGLSKPDVPIGTEIWIADEP